MNASGNSVVPRTRLRHWRRPHLSVEGAIDVSGSFAMVARLLVFQKFLGNCDGVSDGRLAYSVSPKVFPSHKMPLANTTSRLLMCPWVGGMCVQTALQHVGVFDVLPPSAF